MSAVIIKDDPHVDWRDAVELRLTYEGELLAKSSDGKRAPSRATATQRIRKHFHKQLKRAWDVMPQLNGRIEGSSSLLLKAGPPPHDIPTLSARFVRGAYNFVPLVTRDLIFVSSLDILILRPEAPGAGVMSGDVDNRVKSLLDALTMPIDQSQLGTFLTPDEVEKPFFCLLENDNVVTRLTVEIDTMLEPVNGAYSANDVRVLITARLVAADFQTGGRYV